MIQSIERALKILEIIVQRKEGATLGEISMLSELNPTTAHNIIKTLITCGYVSQDRQRGAYRIGNKTFQLSGIYNPTDRLVRIAEPVMVELRDRISETVVLAVLNGFKIDMINVRSGAGELSINHKHFDGRLHASGTGKLLMAYKEWDFVLEYERTYGLQKFGSRTITDIEDLKNELEKIRVDGCSLAVDEGHDGAVAIGVPVFDSAERVIASLGSSFPSKRFEGGRKKKIIDEVVQAGKKLSYALSANKNGDFLSS